VNPTTAEISGIAPALDTGYTPGIPIVYARKTKPITIPNTVFLTPVPSHTNQREVDTGALIEKTFEGGSQR